MISWPLVKIAPPLVVAVLLINLESDISKIKPEVYIAPPLGEVLLMNVVPVIIQPTWLICITPFPVFELLINVQLVTYWL